MNKNNQKIEHILDQALELKKNGIPLPEILRRFPERRAELEELLRAARIARSEGQRIAPSEAFAERAFRLLPEREPVRAAIASFRRLLVRALIAVPAGIAVILFMLIAYSQIKSPALPAIPTIEELTKEAAELESGAGAEDAAGISAQERAALGLEPEPAPESPPEAQRFTTPAPTQTPSPAPAPPPAPSAPLTSSRQAVQNIIVIEPTADQEVGLPLEIRGQARVFENNLQYRVKDERGRVLVEGIGTAQAPDAGQFGPFEVKTSYPKPASGRGTVEVFSGSAKDGTEINKVEVPVQFKDVKTLTVSAFFPNRIIDPNAVDCNRVFPVARRVARTPEVAASALEELLRGPSLDEAKRGYVTSMNSGVRLQKLVIRDGVASADFDETLELAVGGSCRVTAIRSQITETLKQFPAVKAVVISINGRAADILQP